MYHLQNHILKSNKIIENWFRIWLCMYTRWMQNSLFSRGALNCSRSKLNKLGVEVNKLCRTKTECQNKLVWCLKRFSHDENTAGKNDTTPVSWLTHIWHSIDHFLLKNFPTRLPPEISSVQGRKKDCTIMPKDALNWLGFKAPWNVLHMLKPTRDTLPTFYYTMTKKVKFNPCVLDFGNSASLFFFLRL